MHRKQQKGVRVHTISRFVIAFFLVMALCVSSLISVVANTVSATVIDNGETYTFTMNSTAAADIIEKAESMGMPKLGELDIYEQVGKTTTVNVRRGVQMTLKERAGTSELIVYKGDSIQKALEENHVLLKSKDQVLPSKDTIISEALSVEVKRHSAVTVEADDKTYPVELIDGTVAQALAEAGVTVDEKDTLNYPAEEPLFDGMSIKVSRTVSVKITADGETKAFTLSAKSVGQALEKQGYSYDEDDIVTPKPSFKLKNGMEIVIQRMEIKEIEETTEIPFEVKEETTDALYTDESQEKTAGVKGERAISYRVTYVDGKETTKEVLEEKVVKEPVTRVVEKGSKERPASTPVSNGSGTGSTPTSSNVIYGLATAYCDQGITACGDVAGYDYVAVNPNQIPYGSKLYIRTTDGAYERYATASDTGGNLLNGNVTVDVWFPTLEECIQFGSRSVEVYIIG